MGNTNKRVLHKLSGEALMGNLAYGIDPTIVDAIAQEIAETAAQGVQIAVVVGGGNIFRGVKGAASGMDRAITAWHSAALQTVESAPPPQFAAGLLVHTNRRSY